MHYVYILYSPLVDRYFVGSASNPEKGLKRHNLGKNKHTKAGIPWNMVFQESFDDRQLALKKEKRIKSSKNRKELVEFIKGLKK